MLYWLHSQFNRTNYSSQSKKSKGFTGSTNDWTLVYYEEFNSQSEAIQREKQIKNWNSKIKIQELI
nr:GIY-YIG nuclease family protein [Flavobacterium sp. N2820]